MLLSELNGIRPSRRKYRPSNRFVDDYGVFGVEIEVEFGDKCKVMPEAEMWKLDSDGSLRNNGVEYISVPMFGEDAANALDGLSEELTAAGPELSHRCGLHVHIDVSGMTVEELLSYVVVVSFAEPLLYKYVGVTRRENIHCLPFSDTGNMMPFLNGIKYGQSTHEVATAIRHMCKYSGFNILPVMYQGSVEFRHHSGEYNAERIIEWVNILQTLKLVALRYSAVDLSNMNKEAIESLIGLPGIDYTNEDYMNGFLTSKDVLNFTRLEAGWEEVKADYNDDRRLHALTGDK